MATKQDCLYYDWGDTAPREYGAFCKLTRNCLRKDTCENCNNYRKSEEGMERLIEIKPHVTGFCYADKKEGVFVQDVFAKLAAFEDTRLTPEQIEAMKEDVMRLKAMAYDCDDADNDFHPADFRNVHDIEIIEAQQQEINKFRTERDMEVSKTNKLYAEIRALTADKDEQAGRLMELDSGIERLRLSLQWLYEINTNRWYKEWAKEKIAEIDALLGGKNNEN